MKQLHMAESAINRLLNLMDDLQAPPAALGTAIDGALAAPTGEMPAEPAIAEALVTEGLGLAPRF